MSRLRGHRLLHHFLKTTSPRQWLTSARCWPRKYQAKRSCTQNCFTPSTSAVYLPQLAKLEVETETLTGFSVSVFGHFPSVFEPFHWSTWPLLLCDNSTHHVWSPFEESWNFWGGNYPLLVELHCFFFRQFHHGKELYCAISDSIIKLPHGTLKQTRTYQKTKKKKKKSSGSEVLNIFHLLCQCYHSMLFWINIQEACQIVQL